MNATPPTAKQMQEEGSLGVSLRIEAAKPPKLTVLERHLTSLVIEAQKGKNKSTIREIDTSNNNLFWILSFVYLVWYVGLDS